MYPHEEDYFVLLGTTILYLLRSLSLYPHLRGRIDRFVFTQVISHLLLVLLLPVYVNLVKELLSCAPFQPAFCRRFSESECKGNTFSRTGKIFRGIFYKKDAFSWFEWRKSRKISHYRRIWARLCGNEGQRGDGGDSQLKTKRETNSARSWIAPTNKLRAKDGSKERKGQEAYY